MKEITKEKIQIYSIWKANDGTEFNSKEECVKYENSARCAIMTKYNLLVKKTLTEWDIFGTGSEEFQIDIVCLNNEDDATTVLQSIAFENSYIANDKKKMSEIRESLSTSLNKCPVFIGRGSEYNECFYFMGSLDSFLTKIQESCK